MLHKLAPTLIALGLSLGAVAVVPTAPAAAAAPCAAENRAAGAAQDDAAHEAAAYRRAKKRLKKAKRAYRVHHTAANRKKIAQAKRARKRAYARHRAADARAARASAAAASCQASTPSSTPSPTPAPGPATVTTQAIITTLTRSLVGVGIPADQLTALISELGGSLGGTITASQLQALADELIAAATQAGGANGMGLARLGAVLDQVTTQLLGTGLQGESLLTVVQGLLQEIAAGHIPADANGLVTAVVDTVESLLTGLSDTTGLPLDALLNTSLDQIGAGLQAGLTTLLGNLLGGLPL